MYVTSDTQGTAHHPSTNAQLAPEQWNSARCTPTPFKSMSACCHMVWNIPLTSLGGRDTWKIINSNHPPNAMKSATK